VLETDRKTRKSWVVWEEDGKYPNVIIEIISPSTANTDKDFKKKLYQSTFRTPDYFWFDPETQEFVGFHLLDGQYQPIQPNHQGLLWSQQLGVYLGIHQGLLRFFTPELDLVPTPEETADFERQAKELALIKAQKETQRAEKLAAKLRELNIDPDTI
jgi:hypothetical protein